MKVLILSRRPDLLSIRRLEEEFRRAGHSPTVHDPDASDVVKIETDLILPRFGVYKFEESLALLEIFERHGYPSVNRANALRDARNKWITHLLLREEGLPVPDSTMAARSALPNEYPFVAKLIDQSQGEGIHLIRGAADRMALPLEAEWLVQEFVAESSGHDRRLIVNRNGLVASMDRFAREGEFRSNLALGGRAVPHEPSKLEIDLAMRAREALGLDIAGVDFLLSDRGPLVNEVNACPGIEGIERATGRNVGQAYVHAAEHLLRARSAARPRPER